MRENVEAQVNDMNERLPRKGGAALQEDLQALEEKMVLNLEAQALEMADRFSAVERKIDGDGDDDGLIAARKTGGSDAQILKKVSTRLQDFEAQITAQLSNMQSDFDKKLSHVNRGQSTMKPL